MGDVTVWMVRRDVMWGDVTVWMVRGDVTVWMVRDDKCHLAGWNETSSGFIKSCNSSQT